MTIVLVILAVLIMLAVLFLIYRVSKLNKCYRTLMAEYYSGIIDSMMSLKDIIDTQVNTIITAVNDERTDVVRLANKVDEGLTHCGNQTRDLKEKINNLETRIVAPIDKINDTHNRIKTLGKGATSTDELRTVVTEIVSSIATEAVDSVCQKCAPKPKTTKKVTKEPIKEGKL